MSASGQEALPDIRDWLEGPFGCPRVVGRPYRRSASGQEALLDVSDWSGGPHRCPRVGSGGPTRCP